MVGISELAIGFDPSFIDILVRVEGSDGKLLGSLPSPGFHNRFSKIKKLAGGNGVNLSSVLTKLKRNHKLVIPCNSDFLELLKQRHIENIFPIKDVEVNTTVALTWAEGEIQFNQSIGKLGKDKWGVDVHRLWSSSDLGVMINWGLNELSHEWVSCQVLAASGRSHSEIMDTKNIVEEALMVDQLNVPLFVEPGKYIHQNNCKDLDRLLHHLGKLSELDNQICVLLYNEEEKHEFDNFVFSHKILHTSESVDFYTMSGKQTFDVPSLKDEPITTVGAGDAFFAGIIDSFLSGYIDIPYAISVAQKYIMGIL